MVKKQVTELIRGNTFDSDVSSPGMLYGFYIVNYHKWKNGM